MKIISYNVNGIRAALKKGFINWLKNADPDVICLQEIKAEKEQLDLSIFEQAGYKYNYWFSAKKRGYSGVAILSKTKPINVVFGTGIESMDFEGRNIRADFEDLSVMSLYLPSGTNLARLEHKLEYMDLFQEYINKLKKDIPNLIVCGDYNICHEAIDIHDPVRNKNTSGFLPQERAWMSEFLKQGFVDAFREVNQAKDQYTWWSNRGRAWDNNVGWRIDYQIISPNSKLKIMKARIYKSKRFSDHSPLIINYEF